MSEHDKDETMRSSTDAGEARSDELAPDLGEALGVSSAGQTGESAGEQVHEQAGAPTPEEAEVLTAKGKAPEPRPQPAVAFPGGKPFANPYLAGVFVGLSLLLSYLLLGAGLGASGALARFGAYVSLDISRTHTLASEYFGRWGEEPMAYYLVYMFAGIFVGGLFSAVAARRVRLRLERGARGPMFPRAMNALLGGLIVGFASRLAQGCTSGQALSGGALFLSGSLVFMLSLFATGYIVAPLFRRQWHD